MVICNDGNILFIIRELAGMWLEVGGISYWGSSGPWHLHRQNIVLRVDDDYQ